jgi:hypothetical protein
MRISARLAVASPVWEGGQAPASGYHGSNVTVSALSAQSFEADCAGDFLLGALVRLKLPCAGVAVARITDSRPGWLKADFVNPVGASRLAMAMGSATVLQAA